MIKSGKKSNRTMNKTESEMMGRWKRWGACFLACSIGCVGIFLLRYKDSGTMLALADSYTVCGFFVLLFSVLGAAVKSELFDGFSYAAQWVVAGLFPWRVHSFGEYKAARNRGRDGKPEETGVFKEGICIGLSFLLLGIIVSVFL